MDGTVQSNIDDEQPGISGGFNPLALIDPTLSDQQLNSLAGQGSNDDALAADDESLLSQLGITGGGSASSIGAAFASVPMWVWLATGGLLLFSMMRRR